MSDDLRYPIGRFQPTQSPTATDYAEWVHQIAVAPGALRAAVAPLSAEQLDTPYRDGGWTVRQVVHHVPDSHMNGYIRTCLALTEHEPTVRPYDEQAWSELSYMRTAPIAASLDLLDAVHARWHGVLQHLQPDDYARRFKHPDHAGVLTLAWHVEQYAWHGRHHVAHIMSLRERRGW